MLKEIWEQILKDQNVRQNLSKLRQEIKGNGGKEKLSACITESQRTEKLIGLLKSEDAKTRKNTALLLGELGDQEYLEPVFQAYEAEDQLFVKSSYLTAIRNFDYREYMVFFKERLEMLSKAEITEDNKKHITEEIRQLTSLVITMEGLSMHEFKGMNGGCDVILLTNRNFPEITLKKLKELEPQAEARVFGAGVRAKVNSLDWIGQVRTYQELLFVIRGMQTCPMDAEQAADVIIKSDLLKFLDKNHNGKPPFYFRVELKSKVELDKRSAFTKKLAAQLERGSDRKFINTTSDYEFEIRLVENKEGGCNMLVKLFTIRDERFSYRREVIPTSIKAVNGALTAELAKGYLKEGAQVLDPFCGVGTMLIERHRAVKAGTMYGLDIQEDAVLKARGNTKAAGLLVNYVNRDFFDFKHEYLFDEIITDMPFRIGRKTKEEIYSLYIRFFQTAKQFLKEDGIMVLYSHNAEYVKQMAPENGFKIVKTFEVSMKEGTYVFLLK